MPKFLFNTLLKDLSPGFIFIAIVVFVLILVLLVFRTRSKRLFSTTSGALVVVSIPLMAFYIYNSLNKPEKKPMSSTAMFKKMEYIEHLKLVSFYSEEILVLGTKENVQKIVDQLEEELEQLTEDVAKAETVVESVQSDLDSVIEKRVNDGGKFQEINAELKKQRKAIKDFRSFRLKKISGGDIDFQRKDKVLSDMYTGYQTMFDAYQSLQETLDTTAWFKMKPRRVRREKRQALKDTLKAKEVAMRLRHASVLTRLELDLKKQRDKFDVKEKIEDEKIKKLKQVERNYEDLLGKKIRALRKIQNKRQKKELQLSEANMELKFALQAGEEIDPEVLIVAPAEIAVYINMKDVMIVEAEDSADIVRVFIPPIAFDSALIELPGEEGVYDIDGKAKELGSSQQGAYFDLFDQLKISMLEKQSEVKAKAIENGIVREGEKMARVYLENFMRPLGIEFEIIQMLQGAGPEDVP